LQEIDSPPELFELAQPVARAMGILSDLDGVPSARRAARAQVALEALRESLSSLQQPELLEYPAAERSLAAVAESLGTLLELVRELGDDSVGPMHLTAGREQ